MLSAARRLAFRIVNPKIAHDRIDIKKDSSLPLVLIQVSSVPDLRHEGDQNRRHGVQQTR